MVPATVVTAPAMAMVGGRAGGGRGNGWVWRRRGWGGCPWHGSGSTGSQTYTTNRKNGRKVPFSWNLGQKKVRKSGRFLNPHMCTSGLTGEHSGQWFILPFWSENGQKPGFSVFFCQNRGPRRPDLSKLSEMVRKWPLLWPFFTTLSKLTGGEASLRDYATLGADNFRNPRFWRFWPLFHHFWPLFDDFLTLFDRFIKTDRRCRWSPCVRYPRSR